MSRAVKYEALETPEAKEEAEEEGEGEGERGTGPPAFEWDDGRSEEEHEVEYTEYMAKYFKIPEDVKMCANAHASQFLSCQPEFLPFKLSGGVDVPFVLRRFDDNGQPRQGIVLMVELKKPKALQQERSREVCFREAFAEQIAGDYLSQKLVTTVLTDLREYWQLFFSGDDIIYTVMLSRAQAIANIQRLLALGGVVAAEDDNNKHTLSEKKNDDDPFPDIKRRKITLGDPHSPSDSEGEGQQGRGVELQDLEGCLPPHELESWRIGQALPYLLPHALRECQSSSSSELTAEALSMLI